MVKIHNFNCQTNMLISKKKFYKVKCSCYIYYQINQKYNSIINSCAFLSFGILFVTIWLSDSNEHKFNMINRVYYLI